ncbi:hypothetical protein L9F63_016311, partial [Diploptera punctata]
VNTLISVSFRPPEPCSTFFISMQARGLSIEDAHDLYFLFIKLGTYLLGKAEGILFFRYEKPSSIFCQVILVFFLYAFNFIAVL